MTQDMPCNSPAAHCCPKLQVGPISLHRVQVAITGATLGDSISLLVEINLPLAACHLVQLGGCSAVQVSSPWLVTTVEIGPAAYQQPNRPSGYNAACTACGAWACCSSAALPQLAGCDRRNCSELRSCMQCEALEKQGLNADQHVPSNATALCYLSVPWQRGHSVHRLLASTYATARVAPMKFKV